jgi:hypothetical protein
MQLTLSPQVLNADISAHYQRDNRVRIENVLPTEQATEISTCLGTQTNYDLAVFHDNKPKNYTTADLQSMGQQKIQALQQQVNENAAKGVGYVYGRKKIEQNSAASPLTDVLKWCVFC